jgi:hypothetical protein
LKPPLPVEAVDADATDETYDISLLPSAKPP